MAIRYLSGINVDSNTLFVDDSNNRVGIGTASPSDILAINSSSTETILHLTNTSTGTTISDGLRMGLVGASAYFLLRENANMLFSTNNTERMRITNAGNVGIGTTSPGAPLDVYTSAEFVGRFASSDNKAFLVLKDDDTTTYWSAENAKMSLGFNAGVNANNLNIDGSGNVGIGTASPGGILDIQQSSSGNTLVKVWNTNTAGTGSSSIRIANSGNNNDGSRLEFSDNNYYVATISGDRTQGLVFRTSATGASPTGISEWMRITPTGNVGIGTSSPAAKLDVVSAGSTLTNNIKFGDGTKGYLASGSSGVYLSDNNSSSAIMFTHGTRNVGIGTTSPNTKLHLEDSTAFITVRGNDASYSNAAIQLISGNATNNRALGVFHYVENSDVEWFAGLPYSGNDAYVINRNTGYTVPSSQSSPPGIGASGTRLFTINSSGNVGVGTASPAAKLDVAGQIITSDSVLFTGNVSTPTGNSVFRPASNTLAFGTASTERMRIDASGNVGIGTTSPNHLLDVEAAGASARIYNLTSDGNTDFYLSTVGTIGSSRLLFGDTANNAIGKIIYRNNGDSMAFETNASEAMRITSAGNVGIATTNPQALLQVGSVTTSVYSLATGNADIIAANKNLSDTQMGTLNVTSTTKTSSGTFNQGYGPSITFTQNGSGYVDGYEKVIGGIKTEIKNAQNLNFASIMQFYTHNNTSLSPRMTIDGSTGNVGIGTTGPSYKLDVVANSNDGIRLAANNALIGGGATGGDAQLIYWNGSIAYYGRNSLGGSVSQHEFRTSGTTRLIVDASGNVGIGTTSPAYKLDIVGDTYTSGKYVSDTGEIISLYQSSWNVGNQNHYVLYNGWRSSTGDYLMIKSSGNQNTGEAAMVLADGLSGGRTYFGTHAAQSPANDNALTPLDSTYAFIGASGTYFSSNVGIGTTSPTAPLTFGKSVYGSESSENYFRIKFQDQGGTHNDVGIGQPASGALGFNITAGNYFSFNNGTSGEIARLNGTGLGIGTTSPADSLHVNGGGILNIGTTNTYAIHMNADSGSGPILTFGNSTDYDAYGAIKHGSSQFQFLSVNRDYNFLNNGSSLMLIDVSTGNVGIGTTSPAASLHIEKTGDQASSVKGMVLSSGAAGTNKFLPSITWSYGASGTPDFARLEVQRGGGLSGRMLFSVANSSGTMTEAMRIDDAARLGIGTTTPTTRLDLGAGNGAAYGLSFGSSSTGVHRSLDGTTLDMGHWANVAVIIDTDNNDSSRHFSVMANSNDSTTATTLMRVLETGNVGIGTTSPYGRLHVYDSATGAAGMTVQNSTEATGNSAAVWFKVAGSTADYRKGAVLFVNDGTGYGRGDFYFASNTSTVSTNIASTADAKMVIKGATGNVGIGTTSPSYKLDVIGTMRIAGNEDATNLRIAANLSTVSGTAYQNYNELLFENTGATYGNAGIRHLGNAWLDSKSALAFFTSSNTGSFDERMRIDASGNVGIGTTSPAAQLHVYSTGNGEIEVQRASGALFNIQAQSALATIGTDSNHPLYLKTNAGTRVAITTSGNVGINTTSPSAKLHVNGSLRVDNSTNFANVGANLNADPSNGILGNDPGGLAADQDILGTPDTWLQVNIGGTDYAIPVYAI